MTRRNRGHVASQPLDSHAHAGAPDTGATDCPDHARKPMSSGESGSKHGYTARPRPTTVGVAADKEPPISQYAAELLSTPQVVLYITASRDSQEAFKLLEEAHIRFTARIAHGDSAPSAKWGDALCEGLPAIKDLVATLQRIDQGLQKRLPKKMPTGFSPPDPRLAQWMEREREQQLAEAHTVLRQLLEQSRS